MRHALCFGCGGYTSCCLAVSKPVLLLQVALPPALMGGSGGSNDPKVRDLQDQLNEVNRKILNNDLDIPPEGERSPSPEPQYDRNGIRLNTREVRAKDRLMERRSSLIEELIKTDHTYRPPADYRFPLALWQPR